MGINHPWKFYSESHEMMGAYLQNRNVICSFRFSAVDVESVSFNCSTLSRRPSIRNVIVVVISFSNWEKLRRETLHMSRWRLRTLRCLYLLPAKKNICSHSHQCTINPTAFQLLFICLRTDFRFAKARRIRSCDRRSRNWSLNLHCTIWNSRIQKHRKK